MNSTPQVFSEDLRRFIGAERWKFAATLPDWPHEYLVRERVDRTLFERVVRHIRSNGYEGRFYEREVRYYEEEALVYWTIGAQLLGTDALPMIAPPGPDEPAPAAPREGRLVSVLRHRDELFLRYRFGDTPGGSA